MRYIYMDNAATSSLGEGVFESMEPYFQKFWSNPSSVYGFSDMPKKEIKRARESCANLIGAEPEEIYFTSGGSEADNWAVKGVCSYFYGEKSKIVTTPIEHKAVLKSAGSMEKYGFKTEYIPVDEKGKINLNSAEKIIDKTTALVSVMYANNEVGTIEPVKEAAEIAHRNGAYFHTDAVQAAGHIGINVKRDNIDLLSVSGHKFGTPKGIGFLYIKNGINIDNLIEGGGQEKGKRAGTENVPYIAAIGRASENAMANFIENSLISAQKRDYFVKLILDFIPDTFLNGDSTDRLPSNANISFIGTEGRAVVNMLSYYGICVSAQSACAANLSQGSYVLKAMGLSNERINSAVRFSLSPDIDYGEIKFVFERLKNIIKMLRDV